MCFRNHDSILWVFITRNWIYLLKTNLIHKFSFKWRSRIRKWEGSFKSKMNHQLWLSMELDSKSIFSLDPL